MGKKPGLMAGLLCVAMGVREACRGDVVFGGERRVSEATRRGFGGLEAVGGMEAWRYGA
jgi:hypothetical protein